MRIEKIRIEGDVDTFGGRALSVRTREKTFLTPLRSATSSEFNYKSKIPIEPSLNNDMSEIVNLFTNAEWISFLNTNGSFKSRFSSICKNVDRMSYTFRTYFPKIPEGISIDDNAIKQLIELQRMGHVDAITLPPLTGGHTSFDKDVNKFVKEVTSDNFEPMVYIDMGLDNDLFKKRFQGLLEHHETGAVNLIGLRYRPVQNNILNYRLIWTNREKAPFLHMSNVPRTIGKRESSTTTMHLLQKWGIDSFSVEIKIPFIPPKRTTGASGGDKVENPVDRIQKARRLDHNSMLFSPFSNWMYHNSDLGCDCVLCRSKRAMDFVNSHSVSGTPEPTIFDAANRLHEYFTSSSEFKLSRKYIIDGELTEYFKEKDGLKNYDTDNISPLNGY